MPALMRASLLIVLGLRAASSAAPDCPAEDDADWDAYKARSIPDSGLSCQVPGGYTSTSATLAEKFERITIGWQYVLPDNNAGIPDARCVVGACSPLHAHAERRQQHASRHQPSPRPQATSSTSR